MKRFYLFMTLALSAAVGIAIVGTAPRGAAADSGEVTFSHEIHEELADCSTCHPAAESEFATDNLLPAPAVCADCHDEDDVRSYWSLDDDADLEAHPYAAEANRLYFSHKQHAADGELQCGGCHGGLLADEGSAMPAMEDCYACHNNAERMAHIEHSEWDAREDLAQGNQCEMCHTTLAGLVPQNHMRANFQQLHGKFAEDGEAQRECAVCHSLNFCQQCHSPTNSVPHGVEKDVFYIESWPTDEKIDDGALLTVQKAHSLTYRYTHGFDARAKSSRCETCHEPDTFCTPCHHNGYDASGVRVVPQSHQMAGFVMVGGSEATNRHGRLAKMDIEACATCHNVEGGDPVCATCHSNPALEGGM